MKKIILIAMLLAFCVSIYACAKTDYSNPADTSDTAILDNTDDSSVSNLEDENYQDDTSKTTSDTSVSENSSELDDASSNEDCSISLENSTPQEDSIPQEDSTPSENSNPLENSVDEESTDAENSDSQEESTEPEEDIVSKPQYTDDEIRGVKKNQHGFYFARKYYCIQMPEEYFVLYADGSVNFSGTIQKNYWIISDGNLVLSGLPAVIENDKNCITMVITDGGESAELCFELDENLWNIEIFLKNIEKNEDGFYHDIAYCRWDDGMPKQLVIFRSSGIYEVYNISNQSLDIRVDKSTYTVTDNKFYDEDGRVIFTLINDTTVQLNDSHFPFVYYINEEWTDIFWEQIND